VRRGLDGVVIIVVIAMRIMAVMMAVAGMIRRSPGGDLGPELPGQHPGDAGQQFHQGQAEAGAEEPPKKKKEKGKKAVRKKAKAKEREKEKVAAKKV
jgi:hypothetical protein